MCEQLYLPMKEPPADRTSRYQGWELEASVPGVGINFITTSTQWAYISKWPPCIDVLRLNEMMCMNVDWKGQRRHVLLPSTYFPR